VFASRKILKPNPVLFFPKPNHFIWCLNPTMCVCCWWKKNINLQCRTDVARLFLKSLYVNVKFLVKMEAYLDRREVDTVSQNVKNQSYRGTLRVVCGRMLRSEWECVGCFDLMMVPSLTFIKLLRLILWETWVPVPNFMSIHPVFDEIFQSGLK